MMPLNKLIGWIFLGLLSISIISGTYCIIDDLHLEQNAVHTPFCSIPHVPITNPSIQEGNTGLQSHIDKPILTLSDEDTPEFYILMKPWRPPWIA